MSLYLSPLRYPGSKSKVASSLVDLFPVFTGTFYDPFVGGGSVLLAYKSSCPDRHAVAGDLNPELVNFWQVVLSSSRELSNILEDYHSRYEGNYRLLYEIIKMTNTAMLSPARRAAYYYMLNRLSYSGITDRSGFSGMRFLRSAIEKIRPAALLLQHTEFLLCDYSQLLVTAKPDDFVFLDPPYYSNASSSLYGTRKKDMHSNFDHVKLRDCLMQSPFKWMLTYDDDPYLRDLYSGFCVNDIVLSYSAGKTRHKKAELLITNYDIPPYHFGQKLRAR